jgi:hypothetical protein
MQRLFKSMIYCLLFQLIALSCSDKNTRPTQETITALQLKRGNLIACGAPGKEFGAVAFATSCSSASRKDFDLGVALLHSFEYDEAEKVFARVIDREPDCAMAYWGVAMANYHTLWAPPTPSELQKGGKAIAIAKSLGGATEREREYIKAVSVFYDDAEKADHATRLKRFEKAMSELYNNYPDDPEAAIFYSLVLTAAADPADKSYAKQKKAGTILKALYAKQPDHPGIIHYIIHSYDYPQLAEMAVAEARKYARIAPSSAHALHMPSHIFTRMGLWNEDVESNKDAAEAAKCYAESTGIKGHWDEELHALDYLEYAYLQQGDNKNAARVVEYLRSINNVSPVNFKVAYAFAAIPARYVLENKLWAQAANLRLYPADLQWTSYPWQKSIHHFARSLGFIHTSQPDSAKFEIQIMEALRDELLNVKDAYKANQVEIQIQTARGWLEFSIGNKNNGLLLMQAAAEREDKTQKHAVTPGEVLPARELLGDMLLAMDRTEEALHAYEISLLERPNRFNTLYAAAKTARKLNHTGKSNMFYKKLLTISDHVSADRPELSAARQVVVN